MSTTITRQFAVSVLTLLDFPIEHDLSGTCHLLDALSDVLGTTDLETLARHYAVEMGVYSDPARVDLFWSNFPTVSVFNLATQETVKYSFPITPREAVRNAYAQLTKKDFNTWMYEKYDALILEGEHTFLCGDWSILK